MSQKSYKPMVIDFSANDLLSMQRHIDWQIAQEQGRNRNGHSYLGRRIHGVNKTKKGINKRACRGKVKV